MVAVACFLPGRAKDLSAPPRTARSDFVPVNTRGVEAPQVLSKLQQKLFIRHTIHIAGMKLDYYEKNACCNANLRTREYCVRIPSGSSRPNLYLAVRQMDATSCLSSQNPRKRDFQSTSKQIVRYEESKTNSMLHNGLLDLMNRSTCFGQYYAHHQELATIQMAPAWHLTSVMAGCWSGASL